VIFEHVAGSRRFAKLGFVDGHEIHIARPSDRLHRPQYQDGRCLRQAFDHQDAGHDRIVRKCPAKVRLVHRQVLDADAMVLAADVDDAVDQKKRIAVRQQPEDLISATPRVSSPIIHPRSAYRAEAHAF
jgi:hypothetical protein